MTFPAFSNILNALLLIPEMVDHHFSHAKVVSQMLIQIVLLKYDAIMNVLDGPSSEYCYLTLPRDQGINPRINLGDRDGDGRISWDTISADTIRASGLSKGQFDEARALCRWIGEEA